MTQLTAHHQVYGLEKHLDFNPCVVFVFLVTQPVFVGLVDLLRFLAFNSTQPFTFVKALL